MGTCCPRQRDPAALHISLPRCGQSQVGNTKQVTINQATGAALLFVTQEGYSSHPTSSASTSWLV